MSYAARSTKKHVLKRKGREQKGINLQKENKDNPLTVNRHQKNEFSGDKSKQSSNFLDYVKFSFNYSNIFNIDTDLLHVYLNYLKNYHKLN